MNIDGMRVSHFIPGRLRLRLDRLRGRPELAEQLQDDLATVPGIRRVRANAVSGSILLEYVPGALRSPESLHALTQSLRRLLPVHEAERLETWLKRLSSGKATGADSAAP